MDQQSGIDPEPSKWTLADLTCRLRQRLLDAAAQDDIETMNSLMITFSQITQASYSINNTEVSRLFVSLEDSTKDAMMHDPRIHVPSVEEIHTALD
jgi:hypothetical protein